MKNGKIVQVMGPVVDVEFPDNDLPYIKDALEVDDRVINGGVAKEVFEKIFADNIDPEKYVKDNGLATVQDDNALKEACQVAIDNNPKAVDDYRGGKEKALGALVGQVMKAMKGKADPGSVNKMLREML